LKTVTPDMKIMNEKRTSIKIAGMEIGREDGDEDEDEEELEDEDKEEVGKGEEPVADADLRIR